MAGKLIANTSMVLFQSDVNVACSISITGGPSSRLKVNNQSAYLDGLQISVFNITAPGLGATIPDVGPYNVNMNATATRVKSDSKSVLRQDDLSALILAVPQIPGLPPTPSPVSFQIKITFAGQTRVKAE